MQTAHCVYLANTTTSGLARLHQPRGALTPAVTVSELQADVVLLVEVLVLLLLDGDEVVIILLARMIAETETMIVEIEVTVLAVPKTG